MTNPMPFEPEPWDAIVGRFPAAIEPLYDPERDDLANAPGVQRRHVFDFPDGLRMIVSREKNQPPIKHAVHFSFGIHPTQQARWISRKPPEAFWRDVLLEVCLPIVQRLGFSLKPMTELMTAKALHIWVEETQYTLFRSGTADDE